MPAAHRTGVVDRGGRPPAQEDDAHHRMVEDELLLGVQVRNLQGLSVFFRNNIFIYTMFGVSMISLLYLCIFPHDKPAIDDDDDIN
jgi:hypothetical protein